MTTISVPTSNYKLHICVGGSWRGDYGLRLWTERSWVRVSAAAVWRCVLGQDMLPEYALSRPRSKWVPDWTMIARVLQQGCMLPQGVELVLE